MEANGKTSSSKNYISRYVDTTCGRVKALEALVKRAVA